MVARREDKLQAAADMLKGEGLEVTVVVANMRDADSAPAIVARHKDAYGRLDVLVNNAGVGIAVPIDEFVDKFVDLQLTVNLRAIVQMYREAVPLLRESAKQNGTSLVVNIASIAAKRPAPLVSVYSATKAGVVGFTQAMNKELGSEGIKSTALCPAFVDTEMTTWVRDQVKQEDMIRPEDIASAVEWLLTVSPQCVVPEIQFTRPGDND